MFQERQLEDGQARLMTMGIHHECQHQELMTYDLQHLLAGSYRPAKRLRAPRPTVSHKEPARVRGGLYALGYGGSDYCYDIELPEHMTYLEDCEIDAFPVTNGQYMRFIEDGGYDSYRFWLSDGWEKVKENGWKAPMYWEREDGAWMRDGFSGRKKDKLE